MLPVYLLLADFVNSVFPHPWRFPTVCSTRRMLVPRLHGISAQNDQVAAGVMMWVIGSFAFLIPAVIITARLLSPFQPERELERKPVPPETRFARLGLPALMLMLPLGVLIYGWLAADTIDQDGAIVRMEGASGPFRVSIFTASGSVLAGPADISVLVQDRESGETILDATVDVGVQPADGSGGGESVRASRNRSTNKLLHAATVNLPSPGSWELRVSVQRGGDQCTFSAWLQVPPPSASSPLLRERRSSYLLELVGKKLASYQDRYPQIEGGTGGESSAKESVVYAAGPGLTWLLLVTQTKAAGFFRKLLGRSTMR